MEMIQKCSSSSRYQRSSLSSTGSEKFTEMSYFLNELLWSYQDTENLGEMRESIARRDEKSDQREIEKDERV